MTPATLYMQALARVRALEAELAIALVACRAARKALDTETLRRAEAATKARKNP